MQFFFFVCTTTRFFCGNFSFFTSRARVPLHNTHGCWLLVVYFIARPICIPTVCTCTRRLGICFAMLLQITSLNCMLYKISALLERFVCIYSLYYNFREYKIKISQFNVWNVSIVARMLFLHLFLHFVSGFRWMYFVKFTWGLYTNGVYL